MTTTEGEFSDHVPVKAAWFSKINWFQGFSVIVYLATFWSHLTPDDKKAIAIAYGIAHSFITGVLRTYANNSVTPNDALKNQLAQRSAARKGG